MLPERVSNIINKYNWDGIKIPIKLEDWKIFEKNNRTIALNVLYIKRMEIFPVYVSKINSDCQKQVILLMIPNKEKESCHYLAVKRLLREIISKHRGDFDCLNCL